MEMENVDLVKMGTAARDKADEMMENGDTPAWTTLIEEALKHDPLRQRLGEKAIEALLEGKAAVVRLENGNKVPLSYVEYGEYCVMSLGAARIDKKQEKNDAK